MRLSVICVCKKLLLAPHSDEPTAIFFIPRNKNPPQAAQSRAVTADRNFFQLRDDSSIDFHCAGGGRLGETTYKKQTILGVINKYMKCMDYFSSHLADINDLTVNVRIFSQEMWQISYKSTVIDHLVSRDPLIASSNI